MHQCAELKARGTARPQSTTTNLHTTAPNPSRLQPLQVGLTPDIPLISTPQTNLPFQPGFVSPHLRISPSVSGDRGCAAKPSELSHRVPALPEKASSEYAGCSPPSVGRCRAFRTPLDGRVSVFPVAHCYLVLDQGSGNAKRVASPIPRSTAGITSDPRARCPRKSKNL